MNQSKKFMYFSVGLILGVIIGASFVWWLQNYDFKVWFTFSGKQTEENFDNFKPKAIDSVQVIAKDSKKSLNKQYISSNQVENSDSMDVNNINDNDSISLKTRTTSHMNNEIVVAKDELLHVRNIKIEGTSARSSKNLDSLLINDKTSKSNVNIIRVEFWRSPINYRGYLLSHNKLILYGIYIYEDVSLEFRNNKLYMLYQNNYFLLEKNDDFQPFLSSKLPPKNK